MQIEAETPQALNLLAHCRAIVDAFPSLDVLRAPEAEFGVVQLAYALELCRRSRRTGPVNLATIDQILRLRLREPAASRKILSALIANQRKRNEANSVRVPDWRVDDPRYNILSEMARAGLPLLLLNCTLDGIVERIDTLPEQLWSAITADLVRVGLARRKDLGVQLHPDYHAEILIAWDHWLTPKAA